MVRGSNNPSLPISKNPYAPRTPTNLPTNCNANASSSPITAGTTPYISPTLNLRSVKIGGGNDDGNQTMVSPSAASALDQGSDRTLITGSHNSEGGNNVISLGSKFPSHLLGGGGGDNTLVHKTNGPASDSTLISNGSTMVGNQFSSAAADSTLVGANFRSSISGASGAAASAGDATLVLGGRLSIGSQFANNTDSTIVAGSDLGSRAADTTLIAGGPGLSLGKNNDSTIVGNAKPKPSDETLVKRFSKSCIFKSPLRLMSQTLNHRWSTSQSICWCKIG